MTSPWGGVPRNLQRLTRKDQDQSASTGWARMELSPDCPSVRPSVKVILLVPGNSIGHPGPCVEPGHLSVPSAVRCFLFGYYAKMNSIGRSPGLVLSALVCMAGWSLAARHTESLAGYWEGESECTDLNSPCHDEHALYQISAEAKNSATLKMDGCKVVNGKPQFMGTLSCEYHAGQSLLTCTGHTARQDEWEFHVSGDTMSGTLKVGPEKNALPPHQRA